MADYLEPLVQDILRVSKFSRLGKKAIRAALEQFFVTQPRSKQQQTQLLKQTKKYLHDTYSVYNIRAVNTRESLLRKKDYEGLLHSHSSTRERQLYYKEIYDTIFKKSGTPKTILDIGCGMNPFSIIHTPLQKITYYCFDLAEKDIRLLNTFFASTSTKKNIRSKATQTIHFDQTFLNNIKTIKTDLCFLFKMTDMFDYGTKNHKQTEKILTAINSKTIVVSFPTRTISNKAMNNPRRQWFERLLKRLHYTYDYFTIPNECFYIITKR